MRIHKFEFARSFGIEMMLQWKFHANAAAFLRISPASATGLIFRAL